MVAELLFLPDDGRQSETAREVARGTRRLLRAHGIASVTELSLGDGRRADVVGLAPDGTITIVEIKSSTADMRADQKWFHYRLHCDRLFFAVPLDVPLSILPDDTGIMVADAFGASIIRDAPLNRLAPATRRAMVIRFARSAAARLHQLGDPGEPS